MSGRNCIFALLSIIISILILTGCSPLLERDYSIVEPHNSKFWESEAAGTLRAESYQDIVNDLLLLINQHTETATVRLYDYRGNMTVADILEQAAAEVREETPMGAYAVEYITTTSQPQRGHYDISIQIGYRRTYQQIQAVVNATSIEALNTLLETALNEGRTELAVRIGYWDENDQERVAEILEKIRQQRDPENKLIWNVYYYPSKGPVGLIEFLIESPVPESPENPDEESSDSDGEISAETDDAQAPA